MVLRVIIFLVINFAALAIGGFFTGKGVSSDWYTNLNKAPWTPPGWVFGFAWTTIMILFSFYMALAWNKASSINVLLSLFILQWLLNVSWNPTFFYFNQVGLGLIIISLLTILMTYFLVAYWEVLKLYSLLVLPYVLWLIVALSLNSYAFFKN